MMEDRQRELLDQNDEIAEATKPKIHEYSDYRSFLRDLVKVYRVTKPSFSFRNFSRKAGFKSSSTLASVLSERRNLTESSARKVAQAFKLSLAETEILIALVHLTRSKSDVQKIYLKQKLKVLKEALTKHGDIEIKLKVPQAGSQNFIKELRLFLKKYKESHPQNLSSETQKGLEIQIKGSGIN